MFLGAKNIILNNFYLYLISVCVINKQNILFILTIFFELSYQHLGRAHGPKTELTIPKCLDRGLEYSCPVHKPPRLDPSLTRRRGLPAFGGWHDVFPSG